MANELNPVKSNGSDQRLEKFDAALRQPAPPRVDAPAFTLSSMADYLAQAGRDEAEWTRSFGQHLLDTQRRKLAYLEAIVGKLVK